MPLSGSRFRTNHPATSHGGGRPPIPIDPDWGGDGGRGGDDSLPSYPERLHRARVAVLVLMASVVMIFVGFSAVMLARRAGTHFDAATNTYITDWKPMVIPLNLLLLNTLVLALSSIALELARRQARRRVALYSLHVPGVSLGSERGVPWLSLTLILGACFLAGQFTIWNKLHHQGVYFATMVSDSFFFILTGAHAAHVAAGMAALISAGFIAMLRRAPENYRLVLDATAVFWHFMGLLWGYLLALMYWVS